MTRETRTKIIIVCLMALLSIGLVVMFYFALSDHIAQGKPINNESRTPLLIGLAIVFVWMLFVLYAAYYWDWGGKHFDMMPKFFVDRLFFGSLTRNEFIFFFKSTIINTLIFLIIGFIFALFFKG